MTIFIIVISFAFFAQSLLGFGGGLICIPILSLFLPVQDVVSMVMIYQFSMGLLIFKTYSKTPWQYLIKMLPLTIIGAFSGVVLLYFLHEDVMRAILATYIILHLARKHSSFDPLGQTVAYGGAHISGFLGGIINSMMGGGGPAFILYLKEQIQDARELRAAIIAMLMLSNIPRSIGTVGSGLLTWDLFVTALYAYPAFLLSLYVGQRLHDKISQKRFYQAVEILLAVSALLLILKIIF